LRKACRIDGRLVAVADHFQVQLAPAQVGQHARKQDHFLPRLAAVGQRDQAGGLQLVEGGEQFVDAGRLPWMPAFANAAFEYHSQVCMWMFIGAA
jgi:hypothetical protein